MPAEDDDEEQSCQMHAWPFIQFVQFILGQACTDAGGVCRRSVDKFLFERQAAEIATAKQRKVWRGNAPSRTNI